MPRTQCRQNASAHLYANINLDEDGEAVTVALSSWESPSGLIDGLLAHENEGDRARRDAFVDQLRWVS